jgi:hypothetical protein
VTHLEFGKDVRGRTVKDAEAEGGASAAVDHLTVTAPALAITDDAIVGHLVVTNTTDAVVSVVVAPYGGAFPYGGDSPFLLRFAPSDAIRYTGELFPPGPPPYMRIDFPPGATVAFSAIIGLAPWAWDGSPMVALRWGFHFASGQSPEGILTIQLPSRKLDRGSTST